jgi:hypothetical protein
MITQFTFTLWCWVIGLNEGVGNIHGHNISTLIGVYLSIPLIKRLSRAAVGLAES